VCVCVCVCVYIHIYIYIQIHIPTLIYIHTHAHSQAQTHTHTCMFIHMCMHKYSAPLAILAAWQRQTPSPTLSTLCEKYVPRAPDSYLCEMSRVCACVKIVIISITKGANHQYPIRGIPKIFIHYLCKRNLRVCAL